MNKVRSSDFSRNNRLEMALKELAALLCPAETRAEASLLEPAQPVVFVVGAPRSGTTLTMQVLASSGICGYPSNLLSRFYAAPYIGGLVQKILTDPDLDYKNELYQLKTSPDSYASDVGKTKGILEPNEFWYFWRRFIPNNQPRQLGAEEEKLVDVQGFRKGMAALEAIFERPFAAKAIILQYNLSMLRKIFPSALFLFVSRETEANVSSLLRAREKHTGTRATWFSVEPPGFERLIDESPERQVAGQVILTNKHISRELDDIPQDNKYAYLYEELCQSPQGWLDQVADRLIRLGGRPGRRLPVATSFAPRSVKAISTAEQNNITNAVTWASETLLV